MTLHTVDWQDTLRRAERLSRAEQLRLITTLLQRMQDEVAGDDSMGYQVSGNRIIGEHDTDEPIDLLALSGVGAEVWAAVDVEAYLQQERNSWQE